MAEYFGTEEYKVVEFLEDCRMITVYKDLKTLFDREKEFYHGGEPTLKITDYGFDLVFGEEQERAYVMVFTDDEKRKAYEKELDQLISFGYKFEVVS